MSNDTIEELKAQLAESQREISALERQLAGSRNACDEFEKLAIIAADTNQTIEDLQKQLTEKEKELEAQKDYYMLLLVTERQIISELEQQLEAIRKQTVGDETAWLVEKGGNGPPEYITASEFSLTWTIDVNKALRLARRADAEAISELCDDAWHVVEHMWTNRRALSPTAEEK